VLHVAIGALLGTPEEDDTRGAAVVDLRNRRKGE
jgi:hypothetical protein